MPGHAIARNIELKARATSLEPLVQAAVEIDAQAAGRLLQTDTYFHTRVGRLKLRETADGPAELIWYDRPDTREAKASDYLRVPTPHPEALSQALSAAWGVLAVVTKRRDLYIWKNVRIHLDQVERLGAFVEFEAVLGDGRDDAWGREQVDWLSGRFCLAASDVVSGSYVDLILAATKTSEKPE